MDYNNLDLDHKREFLMNQTALAIATQGLIEMMGGDSSTWLQAIWQQAYLEIKALSDREVEKSVADLESQHRPFNNSGRVILQALSKDDSRNANN